MNVTKPDKCSIWWCTRPYYARGYCHTHFTAKRRFGSPYGRHCDIFEKIEDEILKARLIAIRVVEFIDASNSCAFCGLKDGQHKELCIYRLSKSLLDKTQYR